MFDVLFGSGSKFTINLPAGEIDETVVCRTPPTVGAGSQGLLLRSTPVRNTLKSPFCSAWVGTLAVRSLPRSSRFHSCDQKKNSLSFLIGPPMLYPKSLRRNLSLGAPFRLLK